MARQISTEGRDKIKQYEALILYAYDDFDTKRVKTFIQPGMKVSGTLTIGYGHTGPDVKPGMKITEEQAEQLLEKDLAPAEQAVSSLVRVDLNDNQFAALVSFAFNVGISAFKGSTLLKKLNKGDYGSVPSELAKWNKSKGKVMDGLKNRRAAEAGLFVKGAYVQSAASPVTVEAPKIITPQTTAIATAVLSGAGGSLYDGTGPVQWVIAGVAVVAVIVVIGLFVYERLKK